MYLSAKTPKIAKIPPNNMPNPSCFMKMSAKFSDCPPRISDKMMIVSIYAKGSLLPLSSSRIGAERYFRLSFLLLRIANTLAASVELITAPSRKPSVGANFKTNVQNNPTSAAVRIVPTDESRIDRPAAFLALLHFVPKPP